METTSQVARFISNRIDEIGLLQKDIATKVGFDQPNMITMIKQGRTRLPIDKIGLMANALEVDLIQFSKMCMEEYQPENWKVWAPLVTPSISQDEKTLIQTLRVHVGGPYLAAISDESKSLFNRFIASLRTPAPIQ
jgi:hypothetical protein